MALTCRLNGDKMVVCDGDKEVCKLTVSDDKSLFAFDAALGLLLCCEELGEDRYAVGLHRFVEGKHTSMRFFESVVDVCALALSKDGTRVAVSLLNNKVHVYSRIDLDANTRSESVIAMDDSIWTLQWHPSNNWLLTTTHYEVGECVVRLLWQGEGKRDDILLHADTIEGVEYPLAQRALLSPCGRFCAFTHSAYDHSNVARASVVHLTPVFGMANPRHFQEKLPACCVYTKNDYGPEATLRWTSDSTLVIKNDGDDDDDDDDDDAYSIREDMPWGTFFEGDENNVIIDPKPAASASKRAKRDD